MTGTLRKAIGGITGVVSVLVIFLLIRGIRLWRATADPFYITSAGIYLVVIALLLVGVAWGFRSGESAEQAYSGSVSVLAVLTFLGAAYYFLTGFVLGSDAVAGTAGIALMLTGGILLSLTFGIPYLGRKLNE